MTDKIEVLERRLKHKDTLLEDAMTNPFYLDGAEGQEAFEQNKRMIEAIRQAQERDIPILELTQKTARATATVKV